MKTLRRLFQRENILVIVLIVAALLGLFGLPQAFGISEGQLLLALVGLLAPDIMIERLGYLDRIEEAIMDVKRLSTPAKLGAADLFRKRSELPSF